MYYMRPTSHEKNSYWKVFFYYLYSLYYFFYLKPYIQIKHFQHRRKCKFLMTIMIYNQESMHKHQTKYINNEHHKTCINSIYSLSK